MPHLGQEVGIREGGPPEEFLRKPHFVLVLLQDRVERPPAEVLEDDEAARQAPGAHEFDHVRVRHAAEHAMLHVEFVHGDGVALHLALDHLHHHALAVEFGQEDVGVGSVGDVLHLFEMFHAQVVWATSGTLG